MANVDYIMDHSWGYWALGPSYCGYIRNNTGDKLKVTSITIPCGKGVGHFFRGNDVPSNGKESSANTISFPCQAGSGGYYPGTAFQNYTFSFSDLYISPNSTLNVNFNAPQEPYCVCMQKTGGSCVSEPAVKPKYTVKYNANGGSGAPSNQQQEVGKNVTIGSKPSTAPTYKVTYDNDGGNVTVKASDTFPRNFKNWNTKQDGSGSSKNPGNAFSMSSQGTTTFYAQWGKATITSLPKPTRPGCKFVCWSRYKGDSSQKVEVNDKISGNITLYPIFTYSLTIISTMVRYLIHRNQMIQLYSRMENGFIILMPLIHLNQKHMMFLCQVLS